MKILVDARPIIEAQLGGVGRVALELVDAYAGSHPADEIVCVTTGWSTPTLPERLRMYPNVMQAHVRIPNKLWSLGCLLGIFSFEGTQKNFNAIFYPNLGFVGRNIRRDVRRVLLLHDLSFLLEPQWFTRKQQIWHKLVGVRQQVERATHVLAVSETTKRDACNLLGVKAERMSVIAPGATLPMGEAASSREKPFVLALGGNDARKNVKMAIQAVTELRRDAACAEMRLVIVGAGSKSKPMPDWIETIARPTDAELDALYREAKVFLYPSWYEGFGLPLHEAARRGTVCVASTSGALPETAPMGTLFANPTKPHHWAIALSLALATEPAQREYSSGWTDASSVLSQKLA